MMRKKDPDLYEQLNLTNAYMKAVCPKCSEHWLKRIKGVPKKCPWCQHQMGKSHEPWPLTAPAHGDPILVTHGDKTFIVNVQPLEYEIIEYEAPGWIPVGWPQADDPKPKPDLEWKKQQDYMEWRAEQRMRAKGEA